MKKLCTFFLVVISLTQQNAKAQVWMGVYGMRPNSLTTLNPDIGGGFGMSFLSKGDTLGNKKNSIPLLLQYGGNFMWTGLGHRNFENVPMLYPQSGLAQVSLNNAVWGMNFITRFSAPNKTIFTPYVDVFGGYRNTLSTLNVNPYAHDYYGNKNGSSQNLSSVSGLNYGMGGGILTNLGKRIKLDVGVSYMQSLQSGGHIADLATAYADAGGVNLNLKATPINLMMVNIGLLFYLEDVGHHNRNCNCNCGSRSSVRTGWGAYRGGYSGGNVGTHIGGGGFGGFRAK